MFDGPRKPPGGFPPGAPPLGGPPGGGRMNRDWTQGNIFKNLVALSWPIAITQGLMTLGPTIDMIWVGKLGPIAIAAVGVSGVCVQLAQGIMMGLTNGMRALIARSIGAKDIETANLAAQQAAAVTMIYAVIMALIGIFFSEEIIGIIRPSPEVITVGAAYLRIQFIGGATMSFRMMMDSVMQASGDSMNPMWITVVYRIFHIILCPFLVFGWLFFPEMGVNGAALTSVISQTLGILLGVRVLFGTRSRLRLSFKGFRFDWGMIWRIVRIGLPSSIAGIQRMLSQFVLQMFMAPYGTIALAAHTINQRIEMFITMPVMAFGMGGGVLVGQNLGAKQPERAEKSAWLSVLVIEVFLIVAALAMFIWAVPVIHIFSSQPDVVDMSSSFLHIALIGYVIMPFMFVLMNVLQSAGDTVPPMIISIVTTWAVTIPLAWLLPETGMGVYGIRWAMVISAAAGGIANVIYFRMGKWKTRRV